MSRRICTIITDDNIGYVRLDELNSYLLKHNNPAKLINDEIQNGKIHK